MKYRKLPVEIEAKQIVDMETLVSTSVWLDAHGVDNTVDPWSKTLGIRTLEGFMIASMNDYVIKGVAGEFYPCKPEIFEATYEKVEE